MEEKDALIERLKKKIDEPLDKNEWCAKKILILYLICCELKYEYFFYFLWIYVFKIL